MYIYLTRKIKSPQIETDYYIEIFLVITIIIGTKIC